MLPFAIVSGPTDVPFGTKGCLRSATRSGPGVPVTEGSMGDGFYEAVVTTLVERR
jgi:hypothetical protein